MSEGTENEAEPTQAEVAQLRLELQEFMASRTQFSGRDWALAFQAAACQSAAQVGMPEHDLVEACYLGRRVAYGGPIETNRGGISFEAFEGISEAGLPLSIDTTGDELTQRSARRLKGFADAIKANLNPREMFVLYLIPDGASAEEVGYVSSCKRQDAVGLLNEWCELHEEFGSAEPSIHTIRVLRSIISALKPEDVADIQAHRSKIGSSAVDSVARELEAAAHHLFRFRLAVQGLVERGKGAEPKQPAETHHDEAGAPPETVG